MANNLRVTALSIVGCKGVKAVVNKTTFMRAYTIVNEEAEMARLGVNEKKMPLDEADNSGESLSVFECQYNGERLRLLTFPLTKELLNANHQIEKRNNDEVMLKKELDKREKSAVGKEATQRVREESQLETELLKKRTLAIEEHFVKIICSISNACQAAINSTGLFTVIFLTNEKPV